MSEFKPKTLAILGRQPKLGLAELESLYGERHIRALENAAILDLPTQEIAFKRLGGTIKLAQILTTLPNNNWQSILQYLIDKIPEHMQFQPAGKFTLGISVYGLRVPLSEQIKGLMTIKRSIRSTGKSVRIIPNKAPALNSAQVLHNKLTTKGAWELLLVKDGPKTILAQTIFVQDIEAYGARDQARPARDARVGMLPPKLAQTMVNLANPPKEGVVLDPFCGTGVLLQEAILMGYSVLGTDLEERMIEYSKKNLVWLIKNYDLESIDYHLEQGDATNHNWPDNISAVASEIYLGRPLTKVPPSEDLYKIAGDVNTIFKKFLHNLAPQIKPGTRLALAVPAWRTKNGFVNLPALDNLSDLGYNQLDFRSAASKELVYFREDQVVARQLIVLEKK
jgi:tRNA (guanine10-N2)-dimethyltransferase